MQTRSVLFDLDGTLVNSLPGIEFSVDCALAACGFPRRERDLRPLIGPPIRKVFSQLLASVNEDDLTRLEQAFRLSYDSSGWLKTLPADSALATLQTFQQAGLQLFLVTNKPAAPTRRIVEYLGIAPLFLDILCPNSKTPPFSSKADMLRHVIQVHQLDPGACLYVGDTSEDHRAATEADMPVAIVSYGYGECNAVYTECFHVDALSQLLSIVETMEMS